MILLGLAFLIFAPVIGLVGLNAHRKKLRAQAHRHAHSPTFSNVYGGSRETPRNAAKKGGWI